LVVVVVVNPEATHHWFTSTDASERAKQRILREEALLLPYGTCCSIPTTTTYCTVLAILTFAGAYSLERLCMMYYCPEEIQKDGTLLPV
jgi:hypothetical protein